MKSAYLALPLALFGAASAMAETPPAGRICVDPHYGYQALYLKGHDIVAKQTLGHDHRQLRLTTTCINLNSALTVRLASDFRCIDKGDTVATSTIDGERQQCRITHVEPYAPTATH